jgi:hypothetical protein
MGRGNNCGEIERSSGALMQAPITAILLLTLSLLSVNATAEQSADEIAKELANPNTALASLTFKNIFTQYEGGLPGANSETGFTTLFQPSLPFPLPNGDKIVWRPAVPLVSDMPVFDPVSSDFGSESGMGDIGFDLIYTKTSATGVLTGVGLIASLPTATEDALGRDKWTLGPELFLGKVTQSSVVGTLINHQWDIAGSDDIVEDISLTTINMFVAYLPGGGWNLGSYPIVSYDWEAEQWTVPLSFAVGKTVVWSGRPWKLQAEVNYFLEQGESFGPDWSISLNITPVVTNKLAEWF